MNSANTLYLVIPCYNEEEALPETVRRLDEKMRGLMAAGRISESSRILMVDDGSRDRTWEMIEEYHRQDPLFSGVKLSRNRGHQNALLAGLTAAKDYADMMISMDADLQDDIDAIDGFLDHYEQGCQIVYGVRSDRSTDTAFKRTTANLFYRFMTLMGVETIDNHADYRLMSRRAVEELLSFKEVNLFLRGMVPLVGFKTAVVTYKRGERLAGESKYPLSKMLAFAINGITSFSVRPIRFITGLGVLIFIASILGLAWLLGLKLAGHTVEGWTTLMGSIWLLGGIQLLCMGVIGEYIGKIYMETKARPPFVIERLLNR